MNLIYFLFACCRNSRLKYIEHCKWQAVEPVDEGLKRPLWKLQSLSCKNDETLSKDGVFACQFDTS